MTEIFKSIRDLISTVPGIKWVDKDYGTQIDSYGDKPNVPFPCVLFKLSVSTETITRKTQMCTGTITVRVAHNLATVETSAAAPDASVDRSLEYETLAQAVYAKLQGYTQTPFNNFDRFSYLDESRGDGLSVKRMMFNIGFVDDSASN